MSEKWDGKLVMSTPGGPIVTMSLGDLLARKDAEIERLRAEIDTATRERDEARAEVTRMQELLRGISINMVDLIEQLTRERDAARAENDRLRADIERLRAEVERLTRERDESRAEVARLCDDIEHLLSLSLRP